MRSLDWVLIQHGRFPFKKEMFGHRYAQGAFHVKMKAVIRVMFPQAKERQRLAANHKKLGERDRIDLSLAALRRNQFCQHLHL